MEYVNVIQLPDNLNVFLCELNALPRISHVNQQREIMENVKLRRKLM